MHDQRAEARGRQPCGGEARDEPDDGRTQPLAEHHPPHPRRAGAEREADADPRCRRPTITPIAPYRPTTASSPAVTANAASSHAAKRRVANERATMACVGLDRGDRLGGIDLADDAPHGAGE